MLFNSIEFLVFLPIVVAGYFLIPHRYRWILLLAASYYFYAAWKAEYLVLIIGSTMVDYLCARGMGRWRQRLSIRRALLYVSLAANLGLLFFFKYANFFGESAEKIFSSFNVLVDVPAFQFLLPVGISFYTFQTLSYSIDVYRGKIEPEKHLGRFALYVSFFPQLVAGPIERSQHLLPQFEADQKVGHKFKWRNVQEGLVLMTWGFFKKLVIADRLSLYVNEVFNNPGTYDGFHVILATYFFAFQIYCDFSGYSDIAIGSARIMGYDLMDNFRRPYFSKSIAEFWRRWHISLSTWFRDYVYISLGGNRVVRWRWYYNLAIVFVISGLWHGANWTFVVWGSLHGLYLVVSLITAERRNQFWTAAQNGLARFGLDSSRPRQIVGVLVTFHLVLIAWVFFRANAISDIPVLFGHAANLSFSQLSNVAVGMSQIQLLVGVAAIVFMEMVHLLERKQPLSAYLRSMQTPVRWAAYYALVLGTIYLGIFGKQEFIYFQF